MSDPEVERAVAMWLRYAQEDLTAAKGGLEAGSALIPRHVCFNAQQAAEKALKARYVARQVQYPFVHDLADLASGLGVEVEQGTKADLDWLSEWALASRYPLRPGCGQRRRGAGRPARGQSGRGGAQGGAGGDPRLGGRLATGGARPVRRRRLDPTRGAAPGG